MPPQRTRASKQPSSPKGKRRSAASEEQDIGTFAFAPTLTPGTFFDPPAPEDPTAPAESLLFPDLDREESPAPTRSGRGGHAKKKPEDHVPRPPNSFILFRSAFIRNQHVSATVETNHSTLSAIIGCTWKGLPKNEKAFWHRKAKEALEEHKRKFPGYTFRPLHNKGKSVGKRKVREVGPKDLIRCQKIADLLNQGYKGPALEDAIAEFDRNHVPEIVTRFEAPITAGSFRRSSSAPLPENASSPSLSDEASEKKARATSSQPEMSAKGKSRETPAKEEARESLFEFDASESEDSYCTTTPSSPYPTTPITDANPSFDFSSFSFETTTPPPQMQHCNPLSVSLSPLQTHFDAPYMFSPEPSPLVSASPHSHNVFGPLQIPFQQAPQSYYDQWSPLSSMPTTPSDVAPNMYVPAPAPSPTSFESHFSYFAPAAHAPVYGQSVYQQLPLEHIQQEYAAMRAKPSFPCYGGQGLAPFEAGHGLAPSYPPPVPTYAM
ncbi:uncharacterized protein PHACADRAFT_252287 [Phanerochaete carnosa HHB-10118-sp]|uniref:HMG box domain-containing protein n=1 Tax=Phanerochaete carnosa (strain HHB-10118-sp) TaxID=650164 RepID=K5WFU1_PHACS|nr:uncharacterized protein PHACADRAFT_252287 [Phanerochaete carnosa HHB-10118-sp]EKM58180.1 hypothetical protein PHACADRAFT_252287 [Phanerochaete carnosa HHB-10118-sp]